MTASKQMKRRAILVFMLNRPGVLNKISSLIRRKMYNVETITACPTHLPGVTRMTLTLTEEVSNAVTMINGLVVEAAELVARDDDIAGALQDDAGRPVFLAHAAGLLADIAVG